MDDKAPDTAQKSKHGARPGITRVPNGRNPPLVMPTRPGQVRPSTVMISGIESVSPSDTPKAPRKKE